MDERQRPLATRPVALLIASPDQDFARHVAGQLASDGVRVVAGASEQDFFDLAQRFRPEVALLDLAYGRPASNLMIAILRDVSPRVRIVVLSKTPSLEDGEVVEKGLFYYLTGPPEEKLVLVLRAAIAAVGRDLARLP